MKHPALTRIFSIALAILCVITLAAGAMGISGAKEDSQDSQADYDRLQKRMEEYNTVTLALEGKISYAEAKEALDEEQEQHDADAAQHRTDLAIHTATKSGLNQGEEALQEAQLTLADARKQYKEGLYQYKQQKEAFYNDIYNPYMEAKETLTEALKVFNSTPGKILELSQREWTFPDTSDISGGETGGEPGGETGGEPGGETGGDTEGETGGDTEGETGGNTEGETGGEQNGTGSGSTEETNGASLSPSGNVPSPGEPSGDEPDLGSGTPGPVSAAAFGDRRPRLVLLSAMPGGNFYRKEDIIGAYQDLIGAYREAGDIISGLSDTIGALGDMGQEGMDLSALQGAAAALQPVGETIATAIDSLQQAVAGMEQQLPEQVLEIVGDSLKPSYEDAVGGFRTLCSNLNTSMGWLTGAAAPLGAALEQMTAQEPELLQGKAMIDAAGEQLNEAKHALDKGDLELFNTLATIKYQMRELDSEAEEMREEKERLDQEALELAEKEEQAQQQRELEKRQTSLRVILMDREGIAQRVDGGMELMESAEAYSQELLDGAKRDYQASFLACILMLLGGLAGIAGIPAAFEKPKNRVALILPVVLCLLCAVAAEVVMESAGLGHAYAAIFMGLFALIQLLIVLPKAKKPGQPA